MNTTTATPQPYLTPHVSAGTLIEAHRHPNGRETCTGGLLLDRTTMTATCQACGRVWDVTRADGGER